MEFLFQKGILKIVHGKIPGLITGSNEKHGRNRTRRVEPPIYDQLVRLQREQLELQKQFKVDK